MHLQLRELTVSLGVIISTYGSDTYTSAHHVYLSILLIKHDIILIIDHVKNSEWITVPTASVIRYAKSISEYVGTY